MDWLYMSKESKLNVILVLVEKYRGYMDKCRWDGKIKLSNKMKKIILWSCTVTNSAA